MVDRQSGSVASQLRAHGAKNCCTIEHSLNSQCCTLLIDTRLTSLFCLFVGDGEQNRLEDSGGVGHHAAGAAQIEELADPVYSDKLHAYIICLKYERCGFSML